MITNATLSVLAKLLSLQFSWEKFVYFIFIKCVPVCQKQSKNILQMFPLSYKKLFLNVFLTFRTSCFYILKAMYAKIKEAFHIIL